MAAAHMPCTLHASSAKCGALLWHGFIGSQNSCISAQHGWRCRRRRWCVPPASSGPRHRQRCWAVYGYLRQKISTQIGRQSFCRYGSDSAMESWTRASCPPDRHAFESNSCSSGATGRSFTSGVCNASTPLGVAALASTIAFAPAGAATRTEENPKAERHRWGRLLLGGGGSMFVGWYTERLQEEYRDMCTAESVLCVKVVEEYPTDAWPLQLLERNQESGSLVRNSTAMCSDGKRSGQRKSSTEACQRTCNNNSTATDRHSNMPTGSFSCAEDHRVDLTPEQAISRWQDFACCRPGFISSRVYVHVNSGTRSAAAIVIGPSQHQHTEPRRYLILDRWSTKNAADAAMDGLYSNLVWGKSSQMSSSLQQEQSSESGQPQHQDYVLGRQKKDSRLGQQRQGRRRGDQQAIYVFDSRQTASLWRACFASLFCAGAAIPALTEER